MIQTKFVNMKNWQFELLPLSCALLPRLRVGMRVGYRRGCYNSTVICDVIVLLNTRARGNMQSSYSLSFTFIRNQMWTSKKDSKINFWTKKCESSSIYLIHPFIIHLLERYKNIFQIQYKLDSSQTSHWPKKKKKKLLLSLSLNAYGWFIEALTMTTMHGVIDQIRDNSEMHWGLWHCLCFFWSSPTLSHSIHVTILNILFSFFNWHKNVQTCCVDLNDTKTNGYTCTH